LAYCRVHFFGGTSVTHDPASGIYLIRNTPQLIEQLRQRVIEKKKKNGMWKSATSV